MTQIPGALKLGRCSRRGVREGWGWGRGLDIAGEKLLL